MFPNLLTHRKSGFLKLGLPILLFFVFSGLGISSAQTPCDASSPKICISSTTPTQITTGQSGILVINGQLFTNTTTVKLIGFDDLDAAFINTTQLQAAIPNTLAVGAYIIEVADSGITADLHPTLTVLPPPPATAAPQATAIPSEVPIPSDIPGTPSLLVRSFSASPSTIKPGDTVSFTVEVVNLGNRVAQRVSVSIDSGGKFIASGGQASVLLPDIGVGGSFAFNISAIAASDTPGGAQSVALTFNYSDFSGTPYTASGSLTVNVEAITQASQVTLSRYLVDPNPVVPGQPVTITVLLSNTGNDVAQQVLVSIGGEGILLAGAQGNSFPVGDIPAGGSASVDMPLIVSGSAKSGPQSQGLTINYLQKGEAKTFNGSMTLEVDKIDVPAPVLNLESYSAGADYLQPGQQFTLTITLKNIGDAIATGLTVTFGSVETTGGGADPTPGSSSSTSVTPSNTFAPLGSGGTQFIGDVGFSEDDDVTLTQDFIVSGSVDSGVYGLPITLQYTRPDGSASQNKLSASLVVLVPPQIRVVESSPLPESVSLGDTLTLALEINNRGRKIVNFTNATITAENADIIEGADTYLGPVRDNDSTTLTGIIIPSAEGQTVVTVTLNYTDDLNQPKTIEQTYTVEVGPAPPPIDFEQPTPDFGNGGLPGEEPPPIDQRDLLGRLLLGLLGLGS